MNTSGELGIGVWDDLAGYGRNVNGRAGMRLLIRLVALILCVYVPGFSLRFGQKFGFTHFNEL
jgi:hypothetical protein